MKLTLYSVLIFLSIIMNSIGDSIKLEVLQEMQKKIENDSTTEFMLDINKNAWPAPYIPSSWHVNHISTSQQKITDTLARNIGKLLTDKLAIAAVSVQQAPSDGSLYESTMTLAKLSKWCSSTKGYGNILLARRALDISAVGMAKLLVSGNLSKDKLKSLLENAEDPLWYSLDFRMDILNNDAGSNIFASANEREMSQTWSSGKLLLLESREPQRKAQRSSYSPLFHLTESKQIVDNLSYFDDLEVSQIKPFTLISIWELNWHEVFAVTGLELQSLNKVRALAEYIQDVGFLPSESVFSPDETNKIKVWSDKFTNENKIARIVTPRGIFNSMQEAAFSKAWRDYLDKSGVDLLLLAPARLNLDSIAWQAYQEVKTGKFMDSDSQQTN